MRQLERLLFMTRLVNTSTHRQDAFWEILFSLLAAIGFSLKSILVKLAYVYAVDAVTLLTLRMVFSVPFISVDCRHPPDWFRRGFADRLGVCHLPGPCISRRACFGTADQRVIACVSRCRCSQFEQPQRCSADKLTCRINLPYFASGGP